MEQRTRRVSQCVQVGYRNGFNDVTTVMLLAGRLQVESAGRQSEVTSKDLLPNATGRTDVHRWRCSHVDV